MPTPITAVAFDMIQTVFSLEPLRKKLTDVGLTAQALETWFAHTLLDGFALAVTGSYQPLLEVARGTLEGLLVKHGLPTADSTLKQILSGFSELSAERDAGSAMQRLRNSGVRVLALTNGSSGNTERLLKNSGLDAYVEKIVSIDDAKAWKPRAEVYLHAARVAGCPPERMALVAAHAWDCHGAAHAGLRTAWVSRIERLFNPALGRPDIQGDTLIAVSDRLLEMNA